MSGEQALGSHQLWGGKVVTFDEVLEQALEMLRRRGRVSYRALKVQFQLDDDLLELLTDEIVAVRSLPGTRRASCWSGPATPPPLSLPSPLRQTRSRLRSLTPHPISWKKFLPPAVRWKVSANTSRCSLRT